MNFREPEGKIAYESNECEWISSQDAYTADQMRQMRIDALEEAAKICDRRPRVDMFRYIANRENAYYVACADAIRNLKEKKHE